MNYRLMLGALPVAAGLLLAACGGYGTGGSTSTPATSGAGSSVTPTPTPSGPATIGTGSTSLGTVLTNPQGLTLYYFTPEKGGTVACTGGCATAWPPLKPTGTLSAPSNISGSLGTVALADGSMEVTYNGWPLHTYAQDTAPGQATGQGIAGKWFAATPSLSASGASPSASANPYGY